MPEKIRFSFKEMLILAVLWGYFYHFVSQKSRFRQFFKVFFELFKECLFFFTQKSKFWFYFQLKRLIHDPEFGDFRSNMWSFWRFWRAVLTILGGHKVVFCTFQSCSGVFRKCFGILLGLNRPTSGSISQQRLFPKIYSPPLGSRWSPTKLWLRFRKIRISRSHL